MCGFIKFSTCNLIKDVSLFGTLFNIGPSNAKFVYALSLI